MHSMCKIKNMCVNMLIDDKKNIGKCIKKWKYDLKRQKKCKIKVS